jgi:hypothetical protein
MDVFAVVVGGTVIIVISVFGLTLWKLVKPEMTLKYKDFVLRLGESKDQEDDGSNDQPSAK